MKFFVATVIAAATGASATIFRVAGSGVLYHNPPLIVNVFDSATTTTESPKTPDSTPTVDASSVALNATASVIYETVDVYTTYCPEATTITHGSKTYTVTEATTLTITDCPCTITRPVLTTSSVICKDDCSATSTPAETSTETSTEAPYPTSSKAKTTTHATGTGVVTTKTQPPVPTAAAGKAVPALAGMVGLMAALL